MKKLGLYLHIPFCQRKCNYCDFLSFEKTDSECHKQYIEEMKNEIENYSRVYGETIIDTVFIGGGTPSLIEASLIGDILSFTRSVFSVEKNAEITLEANPGTLTRSKLESYASYGINRLSIGVQSLNEEILKTLGRIHSVADFYENYQAAREAGFKNINIDLMFAVPGHTMEIWEDTLKKAVKLSPEHISFYSLQLEENTPFFRAFERGELKMVEDDLDRDMYHRALSFLEESGYEPYEISNCAKKGFECKHNMKYWSMEDYLGIGLGAHSFVGGERFFNCNDLRNYIDGRNETEKHNNSRSDNMTEYMITGMRKRTGVDLDDFALRFDIQVFDAFDGNSLQKYIDDGYLILDKRRLKFTDLGIDISNSILIEFV